MSTAPVTVTITQGDALELAKSLRANPADTLAIAEILERHLPTDTPSAAWLGAAGELAKYVAAERAKARRS